MDIYSYIIQLFQEITTTFGAGLNKAMVEVLKINIILNVVGMLVIIIFAVKKLQEGDFFTWKNSVSVMIMIVYLGFFNWAISNPTTYLEGFGELISYPSEILTQYISQSVVSIVPTGGAGASQNPVGYLIQKSFESASQITLNAMPEFGITGVAGSIVAFILAIAYFIASIIFILMVLLVILVAGIQVSIWKALSLLMVILMFLPQTRRMVGSYCTFIFGLTMYKPLVLVMCFFNYKISDYIITNSPTRSELLSANGWVDLSINGAIKQVEITSYIGLGIIGCFISVYLVKQVPQFIQTVFGATGAIGQGIAGAATLAMSKSSGALAGGGMGAIAGMAKNSWQNAGGGIGGLASAVGSGLVGNAMGKLSQKGLELGNKALNKATGGSIGSPDGIKGSIGENINNAINNKIAGGAKLNDIVSKGVNAGSKTAKNIGNKLKK